MIYPAAANNPLRTRADLQQLVLDLWTPVADEFRRDGAAALLGDNRAWFGSRAESMEGFARALWGLAPLRAGGWKGAAVNWAVLRDVLVEGTGTGPRAWGVIEKDFDQRMVEAPAIALALVWAREELWEPLGEAERAQVVDWFFRINHHQSVENNWLWFRVLVNAALRALGQRHDAAREAADLATIDRMWHGARGYSDGPDEGRDYYVPMAMHFYGLVYARLAAEHAPERCAVLRERARAFAPEFLAWFAKDGAAIPQGRSLQYRCAQGCFWAALAYADEETLPWGEIKGLLLRHLRHWMRQPIFTETGRFTIGYGYTQPRFAEGYASSSGPYWAQKVMLVLALPETHPFWRAEEAPMRALPAVQEQPGFHYIITRDEASDNVTALAASYSDRPWLRHNGAKYQKFGYSTLFAFSIAQDSGGLERLAPDNMLALSDDGQQWRVRERCEEIRLEGGALHARWRPWADVVVETTLRAVEGGGHERVHRITTGRALKTFEGGFCVPITEPQVADKTMRAGVATVASGGFYSEVIDAAGEREGAVLHPDMSTHLNWQATMLPGLKVELPAGTHTLRCVVRARRMV